jgi:diguanylate cyclase (GGDEF)-like protein
MMVSIGNKLAELEVEERIAQVAGQTLADMLKLMLDELPLPEGNLAARFQEQMVEIIRDARNSSTIHDVDAAKGKFAFAWKTFQSVTKELLDQKNQDQMYLLGVVQEAQHRLIGHHMQYTGHVANSAEGLGNITRATSLMATRNAVQREVDKLVECMNLMEHAAQSSVSRLEQQVHKYRSTLEEVSQFASTDPLTGLSNRRAGEMRTNAVLMQEMPCVAIMLDLNGFKEINDTYGHGCGDQVLSAFARGLANWFRPTDVVCRWGGDEFLVVMPGAARSDATRKADELRRNVMGKQRIVSAGRLFEVHVSAAIGIAEKEPNDTLETLFERVDKAMYADKASRNARPRSA